jgi:hypothetical protein
MEARHPAWFAIFGAANVLGAAPVFAATFGAAVTAFEAREIWLLLLMLRLWSCGQPRSDAPLPQVTPEGVAHKSTGEPAAGTHSVARR